MSHGTRPAQQGHERSSIPAHGRPQGPALANVQCPRTFYTDLDDLICKSEQPLSPNTLCV